MTDMLDRVETAKPQESDPKAEKKAGRIRLLTRGALEKVGITPTRKRENLTMGGVGGGATAGALAAILALTSPAGTPAPEKTPVIIVDEQPGEEEPVVDVIDEEPELPPTAEQNLTVENLRVPAGLSAEEYGNTFANRFTTWIMAGAGTEELYDEFLATPGSEKQAWLDAKAIEYGQVMADSIFVPDWRDRPDLVQTYEFFLEQNSAALDNWLRTMKGTSGPAYEKSISFGSANTLSETESGGRELQLTLTQHNNAQDNVIGQTYRPEEVSQDGASWSPTFGTEIIDGHEYIATWKR